jgi:lipopolysaccharide/colanic/teichoic acid biosynthesis glycosyltransferase
MVFTGPELQMGHSNPKNYTPERKPAQNPAGRPSSIATREVNRLAEETFHTMLALERRRAERSRKPFVLMLLDAQALFQNGSSSRLLEQLTSAVLAATRETDLIGWYKEGAILGVIFTEVNLPEKQPITQVLITKVVKALHDRMDRQHASKVVITAHLFPESLDRQGPGSAADVTLYPDLTHQSSRKRAPLIAKRAIDVAGSGILLLTLSPIFAAIAIAIKLTSRGPILFAQERLGQFGTRFKCLKFRTMYANNDPEIHREYVERFIAGKTGKEQSESGSAIYKIMDDPRVTPVGKLLRKLSLDELPQFWNVLRGEMSLVGPRPPVPYEFRIYDIWHRRRVLEVKPGVTGLWQVSGRSRTSFDDMVRLDLKYSQSWSLWLDLKILAATPRAVFTGDGAY